MCFPIILAQQELFDWFISFGSELLFFWILAIAIKGAHNSDNFKATVSSFQLLVVTSGLPLFFGRFNWKNRYLIFHSWFMLIGSSFSGCFRWQTFLWLFEVGAVSGTRFSLPTIALYATCQFCCFETTWQRRYSPPILAQNWRRNLKICLKTAENCYPRCREACQKTPHSHWESA